MPGGEHRVGGQAQAALVEGVRACSRCRPDTELGMP
ncbi:DUF6233 domain-containing protein [Streptomyces sp. TE33382]